MNRYILLLFVCFAIFSQLNCKRNSVRHKKIHALKKSIVITINSDDNTRRHHRMHSVKKSSQSSDDCPPMTFPDPYSLSSGFTKEQCLNVAEAKKCMTAQQISKISAWDKIWDAEEFVPNPNWSYQGPAYTHPQVEDNDEAKKAYCQKLGAKPASRYNDEDGVVQGATEETDPKYTPFFFTEQNSAADNPPLSTPNWENIPVCLGFAEDIDVWMRKPENANKPCKRLLSWFWTETFNMRFIYCIAKGHLGDGGYIWTTASDQGNKKKANGDLSIGATRVTAGECCLATHFGMSWPDTKYGCSMCQAKLPGYCPEKCNEQKQKWARTLSSKDFMTALKTANHFGPTSQ